MKKTFLSVAAIAVAGCFLFSSCIGSFNLSNKLLSWNNTAGSKFVNEVVFVAFWIVPVYEVALLADILVLNSIEFWTGNNPVQAGLVKEVQGKDGIYIVETKDNGYNIKSENGDQVELVYDKATDTWSAVAAGETHKLFKYENDNSVTAYLPNGEEKRVELSEQGTLAFKQSVMDAVFYAAK